MLIIINLLANETKTKRTTRRQNDSLIFKPVANSKSVKKENKKDSSIILNISEIKFEDEITISKPKGRPKKVKTENDLLLSQTQPDGTKAKRVKKNEKGESQLHVAVMNVKLKFF